MSQQPVCIIGAGLAGLTLGRCLRQRGIPAIIFEKASSPARSTYGITVHPWAVDPLLTVLGVTDEAAFRTSVAVNDQHTPGTLRAHRAKLESHLRNGLEIRWDHTLTSVQVRSPDDIILQFQNGRRVESALVIAADGIHSAVRKLLLPRSVELDILPYVVFNGQRRISRALCAELLAPGLRDFNVFTLHSATKSGDVRLEISVIENHPGDDTVDLSYTYSRPARDGDRDSLYRPERALSGATEIPEAFYEELDALREARMQQPFAELFDSSKVRKDRVLHWLMRTILVRLSDLQHLARMGIGMIGDAAHGMPILGGEGANYAIQDGVELAEWIARNGGEYLEGFYMKKTELLEERYERWMDAIEHSERNLVWMHDLKCHGKDLRCVL